MRNQFPVGVCVCTCALVVSLVSVAPGQLALGAASQEEQKDDPSKDSKDVDQTITYPVAKVLEAARQALATYGCDVKKEKPDYLECTRSRHVGVMVGSGGEKVTVELSEKDGQTRVQIKTGKGFVGRLGKKNWSTPIFDEMMKTLKGS